MHEIYPIVTYKLMKQGNEIIQACNCPYTSEWYDLVHVYEVVSTHDGSIIVHVYELVL